MHDINSKNSECQRVNKKRRFAREGNLNGDLTHSERYTGWSGHIQTMIQRRQALKKFFFIFATKAFYSSDLRTTGQPDSDAVPRIKSRVKSR